jgi:hypothetical protein
MNGDELDPRPTDLPEDPNQLTLFDLEGGERWRRDWRGMPEFVQKDQAPWKSIIVHFANRADMARFASLVEQTLTADTRSIWYPKAAIGHFINRRYADPDDHAGEVIETPDDFSEDLEAAPDDEPPDNDHPLGDRER